MKLKLINEKTEISKGLKNKKITLAPEKEGQVLTYQQIKNFVEAKKKICLWVHILLYKG